MSGDKSKRAVRLIPICSFNGVLDSIDVEDDEGTQYEVDADELYAWMDRWEKRLKDRWEKEKT